MGTTQINGGSEKQNAWATDIATGWLKALDHEIDMTTARLSDGVELAEYLSRLTAAKARMVEGFAKVTAKQIIDAHTAKRSAAVAIINAARKG